MDNYRVKPGGSSGVAGVTIQNSGVRMSEVLTANWPTDTAHYFNSETPNPEP